MDHADAAHLGAVVGALGSVLVVLAGRRATLLGGFVLLAAGQLLLVRSSALGGTLGDLAAALPLLAAAAALLAAAAYGLVRFPVAVTPLVLAAAPFRLPLELDRENRYLLGVAEQGQLGRLLPLYAVLAAAALALMWRTARGVPVRPLPRVLALPAAAFLGYAGLSLLWAVDLDAGVEVLAFFLMPFAALLAVVARAPFPERLPRMLGAIAVGLASLFALVGLWQAATRQLLFFAPNLEVANVHAPIFRVTSLFRDPNLYGRHLVLGIAVLLVALWLRKLPLLPAAALILLLWAGLYVSYSQSSMAALFAVGLAVTGAVGDATGRKVVAVTAAVVMLGTLAVVALAVRDEGVQRATSDRSRRAAVTLEVVRDHPVVGVGVGGQPRASHERSDQPAPLSRFVSHTTPLTIAADLGLLGLALAGALLAGAVAAIAAVRRRHEALAVSLAATLLALFVHALFYSGFIEDPVTWFVLGVAAAACAAAGPARAPAAAREPRREAVPVA
jgi:putative inorganic carbon (hco3(-)) transporter